MRRERPSASGRRAALSRPMGVMLGIFDIRATKTNRDEKTGPYFRFELKDKKD